MTLPVSPGKSARRRFPKRWLRSTFKFTASAPLKDEVQAPGWFYSFLPNKIGNGSTISLTAIYITEILGGSVADVGVVSSLTSAATVPSAAFWGWLSDRIGSRKLFLILGFLGFGLPTLLMGFSHTVGQFLLLSVLVGALSVAGTPVSSTLIMDTVSKDRWDETFGRFNQISGWGMVAGRVIGLVFISYGIATVGNEPTQRGLWMLGGGLSMLSVLWAWRNVPELGMPKPRPPRPPVPETIRHTGFTLVERVRFLPHSLYYLPKWNLLQAWDHIVRQMSTGFRCLPQQVQHGAAQSITILKEPLIAYYLTSFFLFAMTTMAYTPFAVWQREVLLNSSDSVFLVGLMNSVAAAFSYGWVGSLTKKSGSLRVQIATISLRVGVFGGFGLMSILGIQGWQSIVLLIVLQSVSGLGWAGIAVGGNSTVAHLAPAGAEGTAIGTYTSFISVGAIVGAFASGYMVLWLGYAVIYFLSALGIAFSVLVLWIIRHSAAAPAGANL